MCFDQKVCERALLVQATAERKMRKLFTREIYIIKDSTGDVHGELSNSIATRIVKLHLVSLYSDISKHHSRDIACVISNSNDTRTFEIVRNLKAIFAHWRLGPLVLPDQLQLSWYTHTTFLHQLIVARLTLTHHAISVQPKEPWPSDARVVSEMLVELSRLVDPSTAAC